MAIGRVGEGLWPTFVQASLGGTCGAAELEKKNTDARCIMNINPFNAT